MTIRLGRMKDLYGPQRIKHVVMMPRQRLAYVAVPKAACSTMKLYLERVHRGTPDIEPPNIHTSMTVETLDTYTPKTLRALEAECPFFVFSVVRDPMQRAISAYLDKMRDYQFRSQINKALGRKNLARKVGFNGFLEGIERQTPRQMNPHWRPQLDLLMADALDYDHVARLENLAGEIDYLTQATNLPKLPLPHRNRISQNSDFKPTPEQKTRVYKIYAKDFEALNY